MDLFRASERVALGGLTQARALATMTGRAASFPVTLLARLESIERHIAGTRRSSAAIEDSLPRQLAGIESLQPEVARSGEAVESVERGLLEISRSVAPFADELAALRAAVERSESKLGAQLAVSRDLEAELSQMRQVLEPLQPATTRLGRIAARLPSGRKPRPPKRAAPALPAPAGTLASAQ